MTDTEFRGAADVLHYLSTHTNWGRWGADDQIGTLNLIDAKKRVGALQATRTGRMVSLSRAFPKTPSDANPEPAEHVVWTVERDNRTVGAVDRIGIAYHGNQSTHLDALCHIWSEKGMWNGREPSAEVRPEGSSWAGIEHVREGIVTRGVLLDLPRFRGGHVTTEKPIEYAELEEVASKQDVRIEPGDALVVFGGRDDFETSNPGWQPQNGPRPGLHASCLRFLREQDVALLAWDMLDAWPNEFNLPFTIHNAIWAFGLTLLDNCRLEPLAQACEQEGRYDFALFVSPLVVTGGTGSPANPIAIF